jgi:hypothetical protein
LKTKPKTFSFVINNVLAYSSVVVVNPEVKGLAPGRLTRLRVLGLPDFSWYMVPKPEKCTKSTQNVPNGYKITQISLKYSKWPQNISTFSNLRLSEIGIFGLEKTIWQPCRVRGKTIISARN